MHGPRAIEIRLPTYAHGRIHPVIHPMYLKLATTRSTQKGLKAVIDRHFDAAYPIESIIAHRNVDGKTEYLVQWEGCGLLQSTWEPEDGLAAAQHVRDRYWKRNSQRELTRPESAEQRETGVAELMAGAVSTVAAVSLARRLTGKHTTVQSAGDAIVPVLDGTLVVPVLDSTAMGRARYGDWDQSSIGLTTPAGRRCRRSFLCTVCG